MPPATAALDPDRPLYRQLIDHLRGELANREPGSRITSEMQLAREFGVSRFTVARALESLADEGLLYRRQGLGTFVAAPPLARAPGYLMSFTEAIRNSGHAPSHKLIKFGPAAWRPDLPYAESDRLVAVDRLRMVDGVPAAIHRSVLLADLVERIGLTRAVADNPRFSLYARLERSGLAVENAVERLKARPATSSERALLSLDRGAAIMEVSRHSFARDGALLDVVDAVYDARRYSYHAVIIRGQFEKTAAFPAGNKRERKHGHKNDRVYGPRLGPWTDSRDG